MTKEIGAIIEGTGDSTDPLNREVRIRLHAGGGLQFIDLTHLSYDPLSYVLTRPKGDKGWTCKTAY